VQISRDATALTTLTIALAVLAGVEVQAGRFRTAEACLLERADIAAATANTGVLGTTAPHQLLLMAWRGEALEARWATAEVMREAIERSQGKIVDFAQYALTILELGLGNYEAALSSALSVRDDDPPYLGTHVLPDLVEAAARSGASPIPRQFPSLVVPACCTASSCADSAAVATRASSFGLPTICSPRSARRRLPIEQAPSCWRPASMRASATTRRATS
jgi:hypothetical protein